MVLWVLLVWWYNVNEYIPLGGAGREKENTNTKDTVQVSTNWREPPRSLCKLAYEADIVPNDGTFQWQQWLWSLCAATLGENHIQHQNTGIRIGTHLAIRDDFVLGTLPLR